jgi:hypothetical protein
MKAELRKLDGQTSVVLADFFHQFWISALVAELNSESLPFVQNGQANNGLEKLGMDSILSYNVSEWNHQL